ncbi:MAG: hypothetical protein IJ391_02755 [Clostridia bacterium]|nr:hypothetical protein [Clostridia bacterium]
MTWEIVLGLITLVGAIISVATPLLKLNTSITKLNCSIDALNAGMKQNDDRITKHGMQIDDLEHRVTVLEAQNIGKETT